MKCDPKQPDPNRPVYRFPRLLLNVGVAVLTLASGCIRYVPSHDEVSNNINGSNGTPIGGKPEFEAYESSLTKSLTTLVTARAPLLGLSDEEGRYRLGTGDRISIDVFGFPDLKSDVEISPDGSVTLPLIGEAHLAGLQSSEARSVLAESYSHFIRSPRVELTVKGYEANQVSVVGEVAKPGRYPLKRSGELLTELLSEAGGRTDRASSRLILLPATKRVAAPAERIQLASSELTSLPAIRTEGTSGIEISLDDLIGGVGKPPILVPLMAGDTILVPQAGTYQVDGEVNKPGSYPIGGRTSAIGAVAAAGGFTYSADVNKVEVIRDVGAGKKALVTLDLEEVGLRGGRDVFIRDGDVVRVPSESGRFYRRQIVEAVNGVFRGVGVTARQ